MNYIDIFDGGPTLECDIDRVRAIRKSRLLKVSLGEQADSSLPLCLVANDSYADFRAILLNVDPHGDSMALSAEQAEILRCGPGDSLRVVTLNAESKA